MRRIYMDANATTPLLPEVFEAMRPFWMEHYGNASSIHQQGQQARGAVEQARSAVARFLHCLNSEIVFTSGGTESDNLALFGVLSNQALSNQNGPAHLITTTLEHHAVLHAAESLEKTGVEVTFLPSTPEGLIEPAALKAAIRPNTKLVSIMYANNETGVIQPIPGLAAIAHQAGALFHTDAVQVTGKLPLDLSAEGPLKNIDLLTLSGHKMYAPKGIGALFVRRNVRLAPMLHGGTHERQRRAGTENVACIVGLGKAAELAQAWLAHDKPTPNPGEAPKNPGGITNPGAPYIDSDVWASGESGSPSSAFARGGEERPTAPAHVSSANTPTALRDRFEQTILTQIDQTGINGGGAPRVSNTSNLYFNHLEAEALVIALDLKGISASGGSACQSGAAEPSHVLTAMGLSPARARASVRFSLSRLTTAEEIDEALKIIPAAVARLRELSPAYQRSEPQPV
jgi:cysteine desulfurase